MRVVRRLIGLCVVWWSQVLVCKGETGSGKTTQLPQYLCDCE